MIDPVDKKRKIEASLVLARNMKANLTFARFMEGKCNGLINWVF